MERDDDKMAKDHEPGGRASGESDADIGGDPLIEAFKKDVDRTLLIDNLRRTYDERARRMNEFLHALDKLRAARPTGRS